MKTSSMTLVLIILIVLAMLWASGRMVRLFNVVFGK